MLNYIIPFILLILLNAFFVGAEISLLAARKTKLDEIANKNIYRSMMIKPIINNLNLFITATQFGSTLVSIGVGWIGQSVFAKFSHDYLYPYRQTLPFLTSTLFTNILPFFIISFIIMVLGELLPKKIMMRNPEKYTMLFALPLIIYSNIFSPFLHFINNLTDSIIGLFGKQKIIKEAPFNESELKIIIEQSVIDGVIPVSLSLIIFNALKLKKIKAKTITNPFSKTFFFHSDDTLANIKENISKKNLVYNRYPIIFKSIKKPIGSLDISDFFRILDTHHPKTRLDKTGIIKKTLIVDEDLTIDNIFQSMLKNKIYLCAVYDKANKESIGVITIGDITKLLTHH